MAALHNTLPADHVVQRVARFAAAGLNTLVSNEAHSSMHWHRAAHEAGLAWATWHPEDHVRGKYKVGDPDSPLYGMPVREMFDRVLETPGCAFLQVGDGPKTDEDLEGIAAFTKWVRAKHPRLITFSCLSLTKIDHDRYIKTTRPDVFCFYKYPLALDYEAPRAARGIEIGTGLGP